MPFTTKIAYAFLGMVAFGGLALLAFFAHGSAQEILWCGAVAMSIAIPIIALDMRPSATKFFFYGVGCIGVLAHSFIIACDITAPLDGRAPGDL